MPDHGSMVAGGSSDGRINNGDTMSFECDPGYELVGPTHLTCTNGQWSGKAPLCRIRSCDPSMLQPLADGNLSLADKSGGAPSAEVGSRILFECNTGFKIRGAPLVRCQTSALWDLGRPICEQITCTPPMVPLNGQAAFSTLTVGATATFQCNPGFLLTGNMVSTCGSDGRWDAVPPTCPDKLCQTPVAPAYGHMITDGQTVSSVTTFSCDDGYNLVGAGVIKCLDTNGPRGEWAKQTHSGWQPDADLHSPSCLVQSCAGYVPEVDGGVADEVQATATLVPIICLDGYIGGGTFVCDGTDGTWKPLDGQGIKCSALCGNNTFDAAAKDQPPACEPLTNCAAVGVEYESMPPQWNSDRQCTAVTECQPGEFEILPPTATSNRICSTCSNPPFVRNGVIEVKGSQAVLTCDQGYSGGLILSCGTNGQWAAEGDTGVSCLQICSAQQYDASTVAGQRVCKALTVCDTMQYEVFAPRRNSDRVCRPLTMCTESLQYEVVPASTTTDRVCATLTVCADGQEVAVEATMTSNRVCVMSGSGNAAGTGASTGGDDSRGSGNTAGVSIGTLVGVAVGVLVGTYPGAPGIVQHAALCVVRLHVRIHFLFAYKQERACCATGW